MKVLIVDDEPMVRCVLGYALSRDGWEVFDHDQFADCPALIREHDIDALISDYLMAGMTGLDIIENVRDAGINIPILILSGNPHAIDRQRAKHLGVREIISKPPDLKKLCLTLSRAVDAGT
jgi:DNA-binding response OmpR family regulator